MEWRGRLRDPLAFPTRKPLAHRLDHLPLSGDHLQRLGDVLAQLRQLHRPTTRTTLRCRDDNALAWQMGREGVASRPFALERLYRLRPRRRLPSRQLLLRGGRLQLFEL